MLDRAALSEALNESNRARRARRQGPPPANAFSYTVLDACDMAGIGRTKLYELVRAGKLRLLHVGGRSLICGNSLRAMLGADAA